MQSCREKDVLWRWIRGKVTSRRVKSSTRGQLIVQICQEKTSFGVELHVKWRVVVQDCQQVDDPICKVVEKKTSCDVELDVKWRVVVQNRQQEDDLLCKFVKKKTSCAVELDIEWRVVVQDCQQEGDSIRKVDLEKASCDVQLVELDVKWRVVVQDQSCLEKDALCHWIRHKVTSRRAKIVKKRMSQYAKLSWKTRLWTLN